MESIHQEDQNNKNKNVNSSQLKAITEHSSVVLSPAKSSTIQKEHIAKFVDLLKYITNAKVVNIVTAGGKCLHPDSSVPSATMDPKV